MKLSKCKFGVYQIDYLGHVNIVDRVKADFSKVAAMLD